MTSCRMPWAVVALIWCQWSYYLVSAGPRVAADARDEFPASGMREFRLTLENDDATLEKRSIEEFFQFKSPDVGNLDEKESETIIGPLADFILRLLRTQIIKQGIQQMPMPEIHKSEFLGTSPVGITLKLDAWDGSLKDMSAIKRVNNARLSRKGRFVIIEFDVAVQPIEFTYQKYEFKAGPLRFGGDVNGGADGSLVTLRLLVDLSNESCNIALDDLQINLMGELDLQITGLSKLNRFVSWITSKIANKFNYIVLPEVAELFRRDIQKLLERLSCDV